MNSRSNFQIDFLHTMKTPRENVFTTAILRILDSVRYQLLILALAFGVPVAVVAAATGKTFATPEDAVAALAAAINSDNSEALRAIFGPTASEIENPDRVQAANEHREFSAAFNQSKRIVRESDSKSVLEVGTNFWPFPVPIVKKGGQWFFDTDAGKEELLNRRIGRNELATLEVVRAYVDAQREYASRDRDGDDVLEYAQRFGSSPGLKDGLYWSPDLDGEISPLGPLAAEAYALGYRGKLKDEEGAPKPFQGYFFKVLTRQGTSAPGGKYNYLINGNMIGGFALVAWPAEYGESGIMTFIVNQQGRVYQKDLGVKTGQVATAMKEYNPDKTWTVSPD
jgi:hypothetical protein